MWGCILLRSPHQGRGSAPAPAPPKLRPMVATLQNRSRSLNRYIKAFVGHWGGGVAAGPPALSGRLSTPFPAPARWTEKEANEPLMGLTGVQKDTMGECLPGARPAHAQRATFVLSILSLAPDFSSPREVPQVDRTRPQTFRARHLA